MSWIRPIGSFGVLGLLLGMALLAFVEVPGSENRPNGHLQVGDGKEVAQTREALAAMTGGEMDMAAEAVAGTRGLVPAGDTCGSRRANVMPPLSRTVRTVFAAASLAASPAMRFKILRRVEALEPSSAWRVRIELSEVARRAGDLPLAATEAEAALAMGPPGTCASDAWFAKALASEGKERVRALLSAVRSDPGHYNAWARLAVVFMQEIEAGQSPQECDAMMARVIEAIVYLDKLARTDGQLARLERLANASTRGESAAHDLLLGMVQERTLRLDEAETTYAQILAQPAKGCAAPVRLVAESRLAALRT